MPSEVARIEERLRTLAATTEIWTSAACGVTRSETSIPALLDREAYAATSDRTRVLLIAGMDGDPGSAETALAALDDFVTAGHDGRVALSIVPLANPDAVPGNETSYPPEGGFFHHPTEPEKRYLWRWTCFQAPDLVVELRTADATAWEANGAVEALGKRLNAQPVPRDDSLVAALGTGSPDNLGTIPAVRLTAPLGEALSELAGLWDTLSEATVRPSEARKTLNLRNARTPIEVGHSLEAYYGKKLTPFLYNDGIAISGRLRLAELDPNAPNPVEEIVSIVEPYVSSPGGVLGDPPQMGAMGGTIWGQELTAATGDERYTQFVLDAASLIEPRGEGKPPFPLRDEFIVEDIMHASTVLGRGYEISGDRRFADMLAGFLTNIGTQQDNGLIWHSRTAPVFWGRGDGFSAMGLSEALSRLPEDHPGYAAVRDMYERLLHGMLPHQELNGMWRQVTDFPGSYHEFTSAAMTGYAIARGLRKGWLDVSFRPVLDLAWQGISERIQDDGTIIDACDGTGLMGTVRDYLDRPALFGFDERSGSMALWFATELERLNRGI